MTSLFGYKESNSNDALAIAQIMSKAQHIEQKNYTTTAQYRIQRLQLNPSGYELGFPCQLKMVMNTSLLGFGSPQNQPITFNADTKDDYGDGYITLPIDNATLKIMIDGGLYQNPHDYVQMLSNQIIGKNFTRSSMVSLTTAVVPETTNQITLGKKRNGSAPTEYMIGRDIRPNESITMPELQANESLSLVVQGAIEHITQSPASAAPHSETKAYETKGIDLTGVVKELTNAVSNTTATRTETPKEKSVTRTTEKHSENVNTTYDPLASQTTTNNHTPGSDTPAADKSTAEQRADMGNNYDPLAEHAAEKQEQTSTASGAVSVENADTSTIIPHRKHQYRDDFATALMKKKAEQQSQRQKQRRQQAVTREHEATGSAPGLG